MKDIEEPVKMSETQDTVNADSDESFCSTKSLNSQDLTTSFIIYGVAPGSSEESDSELLNMVKTFFSEVLNMSNTEVESINITECVRMKRFGNMKQKNELPVVISVSDVVSCSVIQQKTCQKIKQGVGIIEFDFKHKSNSSFAFKHLR